MASGPNAARNGWFVVGGSDFYDTSQYVEAIAFCAPAGGAVASSVSHSADSAELRALVRRTNERVEAMGKRRR